MRIEKIEKSEDLKRCKRVREREREREREFDAKYMWR